MSIIFCTIVLYVFNTRYPLVAKAKLKTETIGVRVPPKLRYGLELLARKDSASLSMLMVLAAERLLEAEGVSGKAHGQLLSLLDRLWSEDEVERIKAIVKYGDGLASPFEKVQAQFIELIERSSSWDEFNRQYFTHGGQGDAISRLGDSSLDELIKTKPWLREKAKDTRSLIELLLVEQDRVYAEFYADQQ